MKEKTHLSIEKDAAEWRRRWDSKIENAIFQNFLIANLSILSLKYHD